MSRFSLAMIGFLFVISINGCASGERPHLPKARVEAILHNERGIEAELHNDYNKAVSEFAESLRLHSSIENLPGILTSLTNMARVNRAAGDVKSAETYIDKGLHLVSDFPEFSAELQFEKAMLRFMQNRLDDAAEAAKIAHDSAIPEQKPRISNLISSIELRRESYDKASRFAEVALNASVKTGDRSEEANALRLLGEIAYHDKKVDLAMQRYQQSLAIDKELGRPKRIADDLYGLFNTADLAENRSQAISFLQRFVDVIIASKGLVDNKKDLNKLIRTLEQAGDIDRAAQLKAFLR
jgi:tetratricopeptide (TPR) repeat protein